MAAWRKMGLKTTYYLRTLAATQVEKSTFDAKKYGYTQKREYAGRRGGARGVGRGVPRHRRNPCR